MTHINMSRLVKDCGRVADVSETTGHHFTTIYRWMRGAEVNGTALATLIKAYNLDINDYIES